MDGFILYKCVYSEPHCFEYECQRRCTFCQENSYITYDYCDENVEYKKKYYIISVCLFESWCFNLP